MPTNKLSLRLRCEEDQPLEHWVAKLNNIDPPQAKMALKLQYLLLHQAKRVDYIDYIMLVGMLMTGTNCQIKLTRSAKGSDSLDLTLAER